jgi:uncharacterized protein
VGRYLESLILQDLERKMVFLGGPRQVGKTTLAKAILKQRGGRCFNWDLDEDKRELLAKAWSDDDPLLVLDELHKFPRWKNWLKGVYDTRDRRGAGTQQILVTGSARLDVYRRGGDSLLGRYHYHRLHPFSIGERPRGMDRKQALSRLMSVGGFPEPFLDGDERQARRFRRERFDRVLRDDVRDLEALRDVQTLALFVDALRTRVGSSVVLSNIAQDLQVAPKTLAHWLEVLERMYLVFVVRPYTKRLPRAIQKPPKVYFFDNMDVLGDEGARFENLVATHLLKRMHLREDRDGHRCELRYLRDKEGREVDFVLLEDGKLDALVEAKLTDPDVSPALRYYAERLGPARAVQVVGNLRKPTLRKGSLSVTSVLDEFADV